MRFLDFSRIYRTGIQEEERWKSKLLHVEQKKQLASDQAAQVSKGAV